MLLTLTLKIISYEVKKIIDKNYEISIRIHILDILDIINSFCEFLKIID